ncbi:MAG: FAD-dependent oxidoreductase [Candidatus Kerfeldbacteria bacterium]|nr:FAD-dependent oxidoreductase [Candidatus Kerfeldbacteria bacterium]
MLDLIIIGGSAAGVTAAIYAARRNLNFLLVTGDVGGEVATSGEIENYPGFRHTDGIELTQKLMEQLVYYKVKIEQPVKVDLVEPIAKGFRVNAKRVSAPVSWEAKTVIIATGIHPRPLPVPQEQKFRGNGLTYCTTCDGPLYKGKTVATIGGGNSALESALMLAELSPKVYLINKNPAFKGDDTLVQKVVAKPNIEVLYNALTANLLGNDYVSGIEYKDSSGATKRIDGVQGVFVHIGNIPNSNLVPPGVEKDRFGNIVVDKECKTAIPGLYAAGDVTDVPFKQIVIAAGQGAIAALGVVTYLNALRD